MKRTTTKGIAGGLVVADAATAILVGYARAAEEQKSSHLPVDFKQDFDSNMAHLKKGEKPPVMRRQQALLESRYDVSNRPAEGIRMSGGNPGQQGVRARLPHGIRWSRPDSARRKSRTWRPSCTSFEDICLSCETQS